MRLTMGVAEDRNCRFAWCARASAFRLCALALGLIGGGCGHGDLGYGVDATIVFAPSVSDAALATVTTLALDASGDEHDHVSNLLDGRGPQRTERFVYRPLPPTEVLYLVVSALDAQGNLIANGNVAASLAPGRTQRVTIELGSDNDLGADAMDLPPYSRAVLDASPIAYYRLDETSGTVAKDLSGHGLDGEYGSAVTHVAGIVSGSGGAARFPGGSWNAASVVLVPRNPMLEPAAAVSVEAWIHTAVQSATVGIVSYGGDIQPQFEAYILQQVTGAASFYIGGPAGTFAPTMLPAQMSFHLVGVYDGASVSVYVNGQKVSSAAESGPIAAYDGIHGLAIGSTFTNDDGSRFLFDGVVDEVAIYGAALPLTTILDHYQLGKEP